LVVIPVLRVTWPPSHHASMPNTGRCGDPWLPGNDDGGCELGWACELIHPFYDRTYHLVVELVHILEELVDSVANGILSQVYWELIGKVTSMTMFYHSIDDDIQHGDRPFPFHLGDIMTCDLVDLLVRVCNHRIDEWRGG